MGIPRLAEFGLSSIAEDIFSVNGLNTGGDSVRWSAPELVPTMRGRPGVTPTISSDVYSLAMVIVEAFTGKVPFPNLVNTVVVVVVSKGGRPQKPLDCEHLGLGRAVWKLTEGCWNQKPDKRPDVANVLRRFQAIVSAGLYQSVFFVGTDAHCQEQLGEEKPLIEKIKWTGLLSDPVQQRINSLDKVSSLTVRLRSRFNVMI